MRAWGIKSLKPDYDGAVWGISKLAAPGAALCMALSCSFQDESPFGAVNVALFPSWFIT